MTSMEYRPQLDALRGIAVIGVLFVHFWVEESIAGDLGVGLFFVLSGFLITRILLQGTTVGAFFGRRARRLLPAFAAAMAFALLTLPSIRATWPWHVFGLTNVYEALYPNSEAWETIHLWSLATEFQFYLVWPFLVLFAPRAWLPWICVAFLLVTGADPLTRGYDRPFDDWWVEFLPFTSLLAGALLALKPWRKKWVYGLAILCAPVTLWSLIRSEHFFEIGELATFAGLVLAASENELPIALPWLLELGKISYGVYLYHHILWGPLAAYGVDKMGPTLFVGMSALSIAVAWASYRYLETPIRRHGFRALWSRRAAVATATPAAAVSPSAAFPTTPPGSQP